MWKQVPLFVNDRGEVRFMDSMIKPRISARGYQNVSIAAHRLIAASFHGCPPSALKCVVDHIDGNPQNNHPCNLRWLTQAENVRHRPIKQCTIPDATVVMIRRLRPKPAERLCDLAKRFGVSYSAARAVRGGRTFAGKAESNRRLLTEVQVRAIRDWAPPTLTATDVARRFAVSKATVLGIWKGTVRPTSDQA